MEEGIFWNECQPLVSDHLLWDSVSKTLAEIKKDTDCKSIITLLKSLRTRCSCSENPCLSMHFHFFLDNCCHQGSFEDLLESLLAFTSFSLQLFKVIDERTILNLANSGCWERVRISSLFSLMCHKMLGTTFRCWKKMDSAIFPEPNELIIKFLWCIRTAPSTLFFEELLYIVKSQNEIQDAAGAAFPRRIPVTHLVVNKDFLTQDNRLKVFLSCFQGLIFNAIYTDVYIGRQVLLVKDRHFITLSLVGEQNMDNHNNIESQIDGSEIKKRYSNQERSSGKETKCGCSGNEFCACSEQVEGISHDPYSQFSSFLADKVMKKAIMYVNATSNNAMMRQKVENEKENDENTTKSIAASLSSKGKEHKKQESVSYIDTLKSSVLKMSNSIDGLRSTVSNVCLSVNEYLSTLRSDFKGIPKPRLAVNVTEQSNCLGASTRIFDKVDGEKRNEEFLLTRPSLIGTHVYEKIAEKFTNLILELIIKDVSLGRRNTESNLSCKNIVDSGARVENLAIMISEEIMATVFQELKTARRELQAIRKNNFDNKVKIAEKFNEEQETTELSTNESSSSYPSDIAVRNEQAISDDFAYGYADKISRDIMQGAMLDCYLSQGAGHIALNQDNEWSKKDQEIIRKCFELEELSYVNHIVTVL